MSKVIGIDLGTTNSCVAIIENGVAKVIENSDKDRNFTKFLDYSTGKFDAYQDMLKLIGDNTDRQSDG